MYGKNTDIIISDLVIKYTEIRKITQENGTITTEPVDRTNDLSKFIVEYKKTNEETWTDATKELIKFVDSTDGKTKFKFSVPEGNYNVRIWTTDKTKQGISDGIISIADTNLTDDEITKLASNGIAELKGDAITDEDLKDTTKIKAVITGQVPIPVDATYEEGKVDTGVVIKYKNSEFVWVPVPNAIYDSSKDSQLPKSSTNASLVEGYGYTPMAIQDGSNYKGLLYSYNATNGAYLKYASASSYQGTTSQYREPALLSRYDVDTEGYTNYNNIGITESSLQTSYNTMVASVAKYGGFFIGRYETSYDGTDVASVSGVNPMSAATASGDKWYGMYQKQKNFTTSTDKMQAEMIWGSQYDAMLNWAMKGTDIAKVTANTNGNHSGSVVTCGNSTYSADKINNIYDLEGNLREWTQEAGYTYYRAYRGGCYDYSNSPSYRTGNYPSNTNAYVGSRLSLYIK